MLLLLLFYFFQLTVALHNINQLKDMSSLCEITNVCNKEQPYDDVKPENSSRYYETLILPIEMSLNKPYNTQKAMHSQK